jgi:hypothetical protein
MKRARHVTVDDYGAVLAFLRVASGCERRAVGGR